jgi:hypothetical protein
MYFYALKMPFPREHHRKNGIMVLEFTLILVFQFIIFGAIASSALFLATFPAIFSNIYGSVFRDTGAESAFLSPHRLYSAILFAFK